jgi:sigma-B regulation protein RsbU (phosphoserine phosphatase)
MGENEVLIAEVLGSLSELLAVQQIALSVRDGDLYRAVHAIGCDLGFVTSLTIPANRPIIEWLDRSREPSDLWSLEHYRIELSEDERALLGVLGTTLLAPVFSDDKLLGWMSLGNKQPQEPFSNRDLRVLKTFTNIIALTLDHSRLVEVELRTRWLLDDLKTASEMSEGLFPKSFSSVPGLSCAGDYRQLYAIGGDYYDFVLLPNGEFVFAIGDVSGKGITASLMMANIRAALRREMTRYTQNLSALMSHLNQVVFEVSPPNRYLTLFYAMYDPKTSRLQYVNAGHNPPLLLRRKALAGPPKELKEGGMVVGLFEKVSYRQGTEFLQPGDVLVAFSDGITEAENPAGEEWGIDRLKEEALNGCDIFDASIFVTHLFGAVDRFVAGAKQSDDMTLVVLKALH